MFPKTMTSLLVWILGIGLGVAGWSALPLSVPAGISPRGLAVGDLFGTGRKALVVANFGAPTFIGQVPDPSGPLPANGTIQVYLPSSLGLRLEATLPTAMNPRGVALFDLGEDGRQEILVTAHGADLLQVFSAGPDGLSRVDERPTLRMPVGVSAARIGPAGPSVVVVADHGSGSLSFFPVEGGRLGERKDVTVGAGPVRAVFGDLDGDGIKEVAVACLAGARVDILKMGQDGFSLSKSLSLQEGAAPSDLRMADLDGDGRDDLVVADFAKNGLWIFSSKGGDLRAEPFLPLPCSHPNGLEIADLDRDGEKDILVPGRDSDTIDWVRRGPGGYRIEGSFKTSSEAGGVFGPVEIGVLDVEEDGSLDLIVTHMRSDSLKVFHGMGGSGVVKGLKIEGEKPAPLSPESTFAEPNPSRDGRVTFVFSLAGPADVMVQVFDITGTPVWGTTLGPSETQIGRNEVLWKGTNQAGTRVASGLYLYRITAEGRSVTKKVAIIR